MCFVVSQAQFFQIARCENAGANIFGIFATQKVYRFIATAHWAFPSQTRICSPVLPIKALAATKARSRM